MKFSKEKLAETINLLDQADMPQTIDDIMYGKFAGMGDPVLFAIQATALKVIVGRYEKAMAEMVAVMEEKDSIIDNLSALL